MTKQEYTKQVVRYLQCSRSKKSEIRRQLESDIEIALSEGKQLEEILHDMGAPEVLAGEFNENIDGNRKKKSRRRLWIILAAVLAVLAIAGGYIYWMLPKVRDVQKSRIFDTAEIQVLTEEVIRLFSAKDYETLKGYMSEEVREAVKETPLEESRQLIGEDWGVLNNIGTLYMAEIRERGKSYVLVQVNAAYEHVGVTFTITFNEEMELYGFYFR